MGDHGELTHGIFLYDETIRVPLLFKLPAGRFAGKRIESGVRLVDVLPTILNAVNIAIPSAVQGESLLPLLRSVSGSNPSSGKPPLLVGRQAADRIAYSESDYPHRTFGWSSLRSLRRGKYLFVEAPHAELYDQTSDPRDEHNLAASSSAVASTLVRQLTTFREQTSTSKEAPKVIGDPELQAKLAALGYVASDSAASPMPGIKETDADPKDKIEVVNLLHRAEMLAEGLRYQDAVPLFDQAVAKEPGPPIIYLQLGTAYTFLHDHEKAIPALSVAQSRCARISSSPVISSEPRSSTPEIYPAPSLSLKLRLPAPRAGPKLCLPWRPPMPEPTVSPTPSADIGRLLNFVQNTMQRTSCWAEPLLSPGIPRPPSRPSQQQRNSIRTRLSRTPF